MSIRNISYKELEKLSLKALKNQGAIDVIVQDTTWAMIQTSLKGIDTHGIAMLPKIMNRVENNRSQLTQEAELVNESALKAVCVMDAKMGPGQHACMKAARFACEKAETFGIGLVSIRNSTHFGAVMPYLLKIANEGFVGFVGSNSLRSMAAFDLRQANLGNNPFGFSAPMKDGRIFSFDFCCGVMSFGRKGLIRAAGKDLPEGAFITPEKPEESGVCEIADSLSELALPYGAYKGASIAILIETLGGVLASGQVGELTENVVDGQYFGQSQFVMAIDPKAFDSDDFEERMTDYIDKIRRNNKNIRIPGDRSSGIYKDRSKSGIPVTEELLAKIQSYT